MVVGLKLYPITLLKTNTTDYKTNTTDYETYRVYKHNGFRHYLWFDR